MNHPAVSVVIPVYNRGEALRRTIDSVIAQSLSDWELIVVDDGSTDNSVEIAGSYSDSRVQIIRQANSGHSAARNRGIELAGGEFLAFLDHDDVWLPQKLERQVELARGHPEIGLVYARWDLIDEAGNDLGPCRRFEGEGWVSKHLLREHNFLCTMSLPLLRTALVRSVGGFDAGTDTADDLDLFLRLAEIAPFGFIPEVLLKYNIGNSQQQTRELVRVFRSDRNCIQKHLRRCRGLTWGDRFEVWKSWGRIYGPAFREQGWRAFRESDYRLAWSHYSFAIRLRPLLLLDLGLCRDLAALTMRSLFSRSPAGAAPGSQRP